jgi:hypothetical protein
LKDKIDKLKNEGTFFLGAANVDFFFWGAAFFLGGAAFVLGGVAFFLGGAAFYS